jgi:uroporphyrinogen decarboxylase
MENKRELMKKVFSNEKADRVPIGFWYHYVPPRDHFRALEDKNVLNAVIQGHKNMYKEMQPDFVKIMSDGFFGHPSLYNSNIEKADDLYQVKSVGKDHPWITEQVKFVKEVNEEFHDEVYTFYSIFAPIHCIRLYFEEFEGDNKKFPRLFLENPEAVDYAAKEIAKDLDILIDSIYKNTQIDGIYYSVQEIQDERADRAFHEKYVFPTDLHVLNTIKKYSDTNILHICGYGEYTNKLELFKDYDLSIVNWATHTENVSLKEGKEYFGGKVVIGGFDNNPGTLLDSGSDEEVEKYVKEMLEEAGTKGVIIGADCTISPDIPVERFNFIRELGIKYSK